MKISLKNYNIKLLSLCIILNIIGLIFIASASGIGSRVMTRQILGSFFSVFICVVFSFINYKIILKTALPLLVITLVLLFIVLIIGTAFGKNAIRWIEVPFIGQFQPAELLKLSLILFDSAFLDKSRLAINKLSFLFTFVVVNIMAIVPVILQPNLSSVIITLAIVACMFYVSEIKTKVLLRIILVLIVFLTLVILFSKTGVIRKVPFIKPYQLDRIETFMNPESNSEGNYQQENSLRAIGSGQLKGKGYNTQSSLSVKNAGWLAEETNDFIFAVVGEEIGFRGCFIIIVLFILVVIECFRIAYKSKGEEGKYICVGVGSWIAIQSFVNMGVATRIIPNTGVPLPFFSQGLSALLTIYIGIGIVLNISQSSMGYVYEGKR